MTLRDRQAALIADLNLIEDAHERLAALGSLVAGVLLPEDQRLEERLVPGCVSRVWLRGEQRDGRLHFQSAADSPMVAGLVALLCHLYSDAVPEEVADVEPEVWQACGLAKMLSPTRLNGLAAVRARIRATALNAGT